MKPGDRREPPHQPLSRVKEEMVRFSWIIVVCSMLGAASASELKIKVVDPQSAAVVGAQDRKSVV